MNGSEFIKQLKKLAKQKNKSVVLEQRRGKGSHATLFYGDKFTIIRNLKDELKTGTYNAMLKQLGITKRDFEGK
jgi:mRNA interferase HicA